MKMLASCSLVVALLVATACSAADKADEKRQKEEAEKAQAEEAAFMANPAADKNVFSAVGKLTLSKELSAEAKQKPAALVNQAIGSFAANGKTYIVKGKTQLVVEQLLAADTWTIKLTGNLRVEGKYLLVDRADEAD